jgi:serine/threonine-protein kinase
MAMELLEGQDLKTMFAAHRPADLEGRVELMVQIAEGLAFAHAHDVVHRDLKPANVHVQKNGQVKIMDFGLARLSGSEMTRTGMVIGTPHYMSPEQVRGEKASARSDVFSLGSMFYELLTFHKAFDAPTMHSVLFKVISEEPPSLLDLAPEIPVALAQIVGTAVSKDPAARFAHAGEMLAALQQARQAIGIGRGHEPLASLPLPPRPAAPAAAERTQGASVSTSRSAGVGQRRTASLPPTRRKSSALPLLLGAGAAVAVAGVVAVAMLTLRSSAASPSPRAERTQVDSLARAVADTQVELARKKLAADDYAEAAKAAEKALRLDPDRADAKQILERAQAVVAAADKAAETLRQAVGAGQDAPAAEAFWALIQQMPDHPSATELTPRFEASFAAKAREAQRLAGEARGAAASAGAEGDSRFLDGEASRRQAEGDLKAGRFATAARRYLKARARFLQAGK